jgi:predicted dehydrogenase
VTAPLALAVVGCGNIGSRHLQALARLDRPARVFAVDPSAEARGTAAARFAEIGPRPDVILEPIDAPAGLPAALDLAVIATASGPRLAALGAVLEGRRVARLLLEKFLFQRGADYDAAGALIAASGARAEVNTPRRLWPGYVALKARLAGRGPLSVHVETTRRNGMASNAVHFLDLAAHLAGAAGGFALDGAGLRPDAAAARRGAGVEFEGVLAGLSAAGDQFTHRSRLDSDAPHAIVIMARDARILIDETAGRAVLSTAEDGWRPVETPLAPVFQSALTHTLLDAAPDGPRLPDYAESARLHRQCLGAFLAALGSDPDDPEAVCPVT